MPSLENIKRKEPAARDDGSKPRSERRPQRTGGRNRRRPQKVPGGKGARLFAPIAIVVVAIACLMVLSSQDSTSGNADRGTQATETTNSSTESEPAAENGAAGNATADADIPATYRVKAGDSFAAIAEEFGLEANTLAELNPDTDPRALQPGQKLKLKE